MNNISTDPNFDFISSLKNLYEDDSDYFSMPYEENNFTCTYIDPLSYASKFNKCTNVSIMSLNIQSLSSKFSEFLEFINLLSSSDCAPDVICLQELWQFPVYANFTLPGYNSLEYKLRNPNTQGGGVGI